MKQFDFTRIKHDINGNPRFVVHFLQCTPEKWKGDGTPGLYARTAKLMNQVGGRKYNCKSFAGGIVFQTYSIERTIADIEGLKAKA